MTLHTLALPPCLQALERAEGLLARARAAAGDDPEALARLMSARLHPEMFDLRGQLQTVAIFALRATYPLLGRDWPRAPEGADIAGRLAFAREALLALSPDDFVGAEDRIVRHKAGFADLQQTGIDYLQRFALPTLWFHLVMAYAILRLEGVPVGKADFDGLHAYPEGFSFGQGR